MKWLEQYIVGFFRLTGFFLILVTIFFIWGILLLGGIPSNSPSIWTPYQWHMINFLWKPTLEYSIIYLLLATSCFMKKYFAFPITVIFLWHTFDGMNTSMVNLVEIAHYGFIYPVENLTGIFALVTFILSLIGTLLWINKLKDSI